MTATIDRELTAIELVGYDGDADTRSVRLRDVGTDLAVNRFRDEQRVARIVEEGFDHLRAAASGYTVSERSDGSLVWLDGQHRGEAGVQSGHGDLAVPCLVLRGLSILEEADLVLKLNADRKGVSPAERHRIGLSAGWLVPVTTQAICEQHDIVIDGKSRRGHIAAVDTAHKIVASDNGPEVFDLVVGTLSPALETTPGDASAVLSALMLRGVEAFWRMFPDADQSQLTRRLQRFGIPRLYVVARSRSTGSGSSARAVREICVELYDAGRAKNRLRPVEVD